jgi:hypothetical protein
VTFPKLLTAIPVVAAVSTSALALQLEFEWTPDAVKQNPGKFSVTSRVGGDDGLIHFEVTRKLAKRHSILAHLAVRKGKTAIMETDFPELVPEKSITYHFAISPEYVADSTLELAEYEIGQAVSAIDEPVPDRDSENNVFPLKLFAPKASAKKTASPAK